ncbi:conserved membrane hypothetical protein [Tenacibaculum dicentrarchi]|nr:conserved membrane hypothetical protein [Tenacibaculum dicentrarchi]
MKHIFYLNAIIFIIYKLSWILNPKEQVEKVKLFSKLSKEHKGEKWDDYSDEYKDLLKTKGVLALSFLLWMFVGLFSFNWVAFLFIILFNVLFISAVSKPFKYNNIYICIHWINSVIGFVFGLFVILNSYHLKIDLYTWLLSLL